MLKEKEFLEIVEAVSKCPKMYTQKGTFEEVVSFLEGYGVGANVGNLQYHSKFTPFFKWMNSIYPENSEFGWREFREMCSSDTDALERLPNLYNDYVNSS